MTTTVLIGTQGNKAVKIDCPGNPGMIVQPGRWLTLYIHGDQTIQVQETGDFVENNPSGIAYVPTPSPKVAE